MTDSILDSTKKVLGVEADYVAFDTDIIMQINTVLSTLWQLGVGPEDGFQIEDNSSRWTDFFGTDPRLNMIKTYVFLRVRLLFDPPTTSYLIEALTKQYEELGWRISVYREGRDHPYVELGDSSYPEEG